MLFFVEVNKAQGKALRQRGGLGLLKAPSFLRWCTHTLPLSVKQSVSEKNHWYFMAVVGFGSLKLQKNPFLFPIFNPFDKNCFI
jgi:hypothetical protein